MLDGMEKQVAMFEWRKKIRDSLKSRFKLGGELVEHFTKWVRKFVIGDKTYQLLKSLNSKKSEIHQEKSVDCFENYRIRRHPSKKVILCRGT